MFFAKKINCLPFRWLLSNERYEEAQITTNRISYWNKKPIVDIISYRYMSLNFLKRHRMHPKKLLIFRTPK